MCWGTILHEYAATLMVEFSKTLIDLPSNPSWLLGLILNSSAIVPLSSPYVL